MKIIKIFLVTYIGLITFLAAPAALAEDNRVILDQLLTGDVPQLNASEIRIPDDLKPGFHELQVEVLDDLGVVSFKKALFCKDLKGELHFDNLCPDLLVTDKQKTFRSAFKPYSPLNDSSGTANLALVAFAVASTLVGLGQKSESLGINKEGNKDDSMGDLGNVSAAGLSIREKDLAWGDRRKYIKTKFFNSFDSAPLAISNGLSSVSALLSRTFLDARYLRAIFGNFAWVTILAALIITFKGLKEIDNQALPLFLMPTIYLICLGTFDALAGLSSAFLYLNFIFANGNFNSKEAAFTGLGVALTFFAPGLIASKFRPLNRSVNNSRTFWDRICDYVLASLLTGWTVSKMIQALPGLSKLQLSIAQYSSKIGIIVGAAVLVRLFLEDIAWYLYPVRLRNLTIPIKPTGWVQEIRAIIFKTLIFLLLAEPFIGFNKFLLIGFAIFIIPLLLNSFASYLPKSRFLSTINPKGSVKIAFLGIVSMFLVNYLKTLELSPKEFIIKSFIFIPIPALILAVADCFSGKAAFSIKRKGAGELIYRILSILIFGILILIILGKNPYIEVKNFILNYSENINNIENFFKSVWHSFQNEWVRRVNSL